MGQRKIRGKEEVCFMTKKLPSPTYDALCFMTGVWGELSSDSLCNDAELPGLDNGRWQNAIVADKFMPYGWQHTENINLVAGGTADE